MNSNGNGNGAVPGTGPRGEPGPAQGMRLESRGRTITESDLVGFSTLTGDWHPQHGDAEWAGESAFGERIAHGMLILSYSVGLVPFDPDHVVALRGLSKVSFKRPVRIGDTISVAAKVADVRLLDERRALVGFDWRVTNQAGELVVRANVEVVWQDAAAENPVANDREEAVVPSAEASPVAAAASSELFELYGDRVLL